MPARWVGALWLFPLLWLRPPAPEPGDVWLTLLDVGQGLAAVVRTQHHALVYDTGPAFSAELDAGTAVVVPFLRAGSDILLAPHHGSAHSSSTEFIAAVRPRYVLFSTGYRNRFGFPRPEVIERYRAAGSRMLDTARHGAITFKLGRDTIAVDTYRQSARHYWNTP